MWWVGSNKIKLKIYGCRKFRVIYCLHYLEKYINIQDEVPTPPTHDFEKVTIKLFFNDIIQFGVSEIRFVIVSLMNRSIRVEFEH